MLEEYPHPSTGRMIGRALRRRCPLCSGRGLFHGWLKPRTDCPTCQLKLNRGEGDFFLGAYTLNFIAVELLLATFLLVGVVVTWPDVPWQGLLWVGAPLMVLGPLAFYPIARLLWLAIDLTMRPPTPRDFPEVSVDHDSPRIS